MYADSLKMSTLENILKPFKGTNESFDGYLKLLYDILNMKLGNKIINSINTIITYINLEKLEQFVIYY